MKEVRKIKREYDDRGNMIYIKYSIGSESWYKYDENNNIIHFKSSTGNEYWSKYDENNNEIYCKNSNGSESWWKYDKFNYQAKITKKEYKYIEFRKQEKEYLSRTKCSRFEIMDI